MDKFDFTKQDKAYYSARKEPSLMEIGDANYISILAKGDPSGPEFATSMETLFSIAYSLKFLSKARGQDFTVARPEALWWFDEKKFGVLQAHEAPVKVPRSEWSYRLMIRQALFIGRADLEVAIELVKKKKTYIDPDLVSFFEIKEGLAIQALHKGPFEQEPFTLEKMHAFMEKLRLVRNGLHHEIYLSDFRKTSPDKLKTILRQPVK